MKCQLVERVAFVVVQVALGMLLNLSIHFDLVSPPKIESTEGWNFGENTMGASISFIKKLPCYPLEMDGS